MVVYIQFVFWSEKSERFLNKNLTNEKIVEIGTQYGCSTLWMAQALGPEGCIYTLEKNAKHIEQAQVTFSQEENKELAKKIHLVTGDAAESLKSIEQWAPFDLVFIDANKNGYLDYYLWAKQFLKSGGYIVADNVYLFGTMFQDSPPEQSSQKMWTKMKHFLSEVFSDPDFDSTFIPTTEGLLVATKK